MALVTITEPAAEPVSLDELKVFLRIDDDDTSEDALITALALAARVWAEAFCRRRFIRQQVRWTLDSFPYSFGPRDSYPLASVGYGLAHALRLPYPPVTSIDRVAYLTTDGNTIVMPSNGYLVDLASEPARLAPLFGQVWPVTLAVPNAVAIEYTTGWADAAAVPALIKTGLQLLVARWYEQRVPDASDIPQAVKTVLWRYRNLQL